MNKKVKRSEIFSRVEGIFETDILKDKLVTIIGLGTGGSLAAVELAKCAVGRFRLVDFDILEIHNISRHACGIRDIGRLKTEAVRDDILNINPDAQIEIFNNDITKDIELLDQILKGSDLVLPCTDNKISTFTINERLINFWKEQKISIPAVYAGAYKRAFGGDIIRVIPGETPCYDCVIGSLKKTSTWKSMPKSKVVYSDLESSEDFKAEPGLSLDVHFIVLIQVKLALLTLLRNSKSNLEDIKYNFILWGNRKEWIFKEPLKCIFANTVYRKDCYTCQVNYEDELGMTKNEIKEKVKEILDNIPENK